MPIRKPLNSQGKLLDVVGVVFSAALVLVVGLVFLNRQAIYDYAQLLNYTPSAEIAELATQTTMNDRSRRVFYVNQPVVQDKADFNVDCPNRGDEKTIVLGCYKGGQNGIFLLDVNDERLDGIKQVTAAHELLHAEYERLSGDERRRIDALLTDYFDTVLQDKRIIETIDGYRKTEPFELKNEMHSIFATEIAVLPAELEAYYTRYFTDRSKIVGYATQYQEEFTSRQTIIAKTGITLERLKQQIDTAEANLTVLQASISERQQALEAQQRRGDIEGYNAGVPAYNALIDEFNRSARDVQSLVAQYNQVVADRNAVASEIAELSSALSTDAEQIDQ